jgi:hypothetical protein
MLLQIWGIAIARPGYQKLPAFIRGGGGGSVKLRCSDKTEAQLYLHLLTQSPIQFYILYNFFMIYNTAWAWRNFPEMSHPPIKPSRCRDFALISEQRLALQPGFNVVSGESGAGKSVLVSALGLVLGANAPVNCIRAPAQAALLEGRVHLDPLMMVPFFPILLRWFNLQ